jgi:murein DD-endopeptidase MepM/ murein hydrolase activator NlpD
VSEKKKKKFFDKLRSQYRLIIYNDTTFQSVWTLKLTRLKVFTVGSFGTTALIVFVIMLIVATPLKEYVPGYPKKEYRQMLIRNALIVDSLENELRTRDVFFSNIQILVDGGVPQDSFPANDSGVRTTPVNIHTMNPDSVFRQKLLEEQLNLSVHSTESQNTELSSMYFVSPVKGMVTEKFKAGSSHYGVDLVGNPNSFILSVLSGTVVFAGWTLETGNVIYIQHPNNLVSVYKHNESLLKKIGDAVSAGEAIAIIGNSGELSTGPHLHFELWYKGVAIDPQLYISF